MSIAIKVENLSKAYQIGQFGTGTISRDLERWWVTKLLGKEDPFLKLGETNDRSVKGKSNVVWSLRDINFETRQGDVIGIIGKNGAGKSTLLKLLTRITSPTTGRIKIKGRIASLLEVGTGFHPELTGRENIYLNGSILGMRNKEITRKLDEIIDFSGVERYIDTPVKRYSSGMYVRLAFAVAAHLESEILIVDEVLAVGDAEFQRKCLGKMNAVSRQGRTVLFVSHNMGAIRQLCKKGIYLSSGEVHFAGGIDSAINSYLASSTAESFAYVRPADELEQVKSVAFKKISLHSSNGLENYVFETREPILVKFKLLLKEIPARSSVFFMILNQEKTPVCAFESDGLREEMTLKINPNFLVRGKYSIHTFLHIPRQQQFDLVYDKVSFEVSDFNSKLAIHGSYNYGSIFGQGEWL